MKNSKLIEALNNCVAHCNYCVSACLSEENVKMMADCIRLDIACAEVCGTTAKLVAMDSSFANEMVKLCKEICEKCADECSSHDHQHCQDCAKACRECAEACEAFLP